MGKDTARYSPIATHCQSPSVISNNFNNASGSWGGVTIFLQGCEWRLSQAAIKMGSGAGGSQGLQEAVFPWYYITVWLLAQAGVSFQVSNLLHPPHTHMLQERDGQSRARPPTMTQGIDIPVCRRSGEAWRSRDIRIWMGKGTASY